MRWFCGTYFVSVCFPLVLSGGTIYTYQGQYFTFGTAGRDYTHDFVSISFDVSTPITGQTNVSSYNDRLSISDYGILKSSIGDGIDEFSNATGQLFTLNSDKSQSWVFTEPSGHIQCWWISVVVGTKTISAYDDYQSFNCPGNPGALSNDVSSDSSNGTFAENANIPGIWTITSDASTPEPRTGCWVVLACVVGFVWNNFRRGLSSALSQQAPPRGR